MTQVSVCVWTSSVFKSKCICCVTWLRPHSNPLLHPQTDAVFLLWKKENTEIFDNEESNLRKVQPWWAHSTCSSHFGVFCNFFSCIPVSFCLVLDPPQFSEPPATFSLLPFTFPCLPKPADRLCTTTAWSLILKILTLNFCPLSLAPLSCGTITAGISVVPEDNIWQLWVRRGCNITSTRKGLNSSTCTFDSCWSKDRGALTRNVVLICKESL